MAAVATGLGKLVHPRPQIRSPTIVAYAVALEKVVGEARIKVKVKVKVTSPGEGGWRGEDAGNGDEVLVARHVAVQGLQRARSGARASNFETSDRGEVLNAAVALLSSDCFHCLKSILKVTWCRKQTL